MAAPRIMWLVLGDPDDLAEFYGAIRAKGPTCTIDVLLENLPDDGDSVAA